MKIAQSREFFSCSAQDYKKFCWVLFIILLCVWVCIRYRIQKGFLSKKHQNTSHSSLPMNLYLAAALNERVWSSPWHQHINKQTESSCAPLQRKKISFPWKWIHHRHDPKILRLSTSVDDRTNKKFPNWDLIFYFILRRKRELLLSFLARKSY